jgi:hypothetical protein
MGFLDNSSVTVDAILTKKGRELLAQGRDKFQITQFALADDEVDYELWNPAHSLGSDYYGIIIENMPVIEAITDESYAMKYKLLTLPKDTAFLPTITATPTSVTIDEGRTTPATITVSTANFPNANQNLGFTGILLNSDAGTISGIGSVPGVTNPIINLSSFNTNQTISAVGKNGFTFTPTTFISDRAALTTRLIIIANETGGRVEVDITVNPVNDAPTQNRQTALA